ncbi:hypothetical protein ACFE04_025721 [Oxalis oulophora]
MEADSSTDFQDWELLHNPNSAPISSPESYDSLIDFQGVESESECMNMIRPDYFSIDKTTNTPVADLSEDEEKEESIESDNPSWVDPGYENRYQMKNSGEFWSDAGSDRSNDRKVSDFDVNREVSLVDSGVGSEGIGGIEAESEKGIQFSEIDENGELGFVENEKINQGFQGFSEIHADFGIGKETEGCLGNQLMDGDEPNILTENDCRDVVSHVGFEAGDGQSSAVVEESEPKGQPDGGEEIKSMVWWRVPVEVMKYCLFKVSPVWTVSMAAAVMGIVILGRRLHKMRRKSRALELKLAVDDKHILLLDFLRSGLIANPATKVAQFMSRAARLNEAFSVVRRVPMVRPPLPAAGLSPWPVMSLR